MISNLAKIGGPRSDCFVIAVEPASPVKVPARFRHTLMDCNLAISACVEPDLIGLQRNQCGPFWVGITSSKTVSLWSDETFSTPRWALAI